MRSRKTVSKNLKEGEDDVKSACPLCFGLYTRYNERNTVIKSFKVNLSSDSSLKLVVMKLESLVITGQIYSGEFVPRPCTHRPSHHES